ncbi:ATP-binding protein [Nesterenkonia sp. AY15]|uniref:ATP-binding protein n=1 Tax=Nesterenkonia sp. AY15 TaxID=2901139 RepID=UPI001F4CA6FA|nr:ATP-binding protein [Nesterenkonia sp. AY15]MCH8572235.1 ATP-binding protein [Nesterenkonia sp. AY15]
MSIFGIWSDFGFQQNPYSQDTLAPDEMGDLLLAGRDKEVRGIQARLGSGGAHPSVEGPIGVGKTSLLNVAAFRMAKRCLEARAGELYLPAVQRFQPVKDVAEFEAQVYRVVAQTLIRYQGSFKQVGLSEPDVKKLNKWLNEPQYGGYSVGASVLGSGAEWGKSSEPNTGEAFLRSGFPEAVRAVLEECFPANTGGVVCILDNLEIVESAGAARSTLDELRDRLFNIPQLRWILCGSRGIVSRARTERLSGIFQAPLQVGPLNDASAVEAITRRLEYFGLEGATAPVSPSGFDFIYTALNKNLRDALSTAQEFSHWLSAEYPAGDTLPDETARDRLLEAWMTERAENAFHDAHDVQPRHWAFFEAVCENGGRAASADHQEYDFVSQQQLVSAVTALVNANLFVREVDPDNGARTVNACTSVGWLVYFYRAQFELPSKRKK